MNYSVYTIPLFDKQAKRLVKKYPSLRQDLAHLTEALSTDPKQGIAIGNNFHKVRLAIGSKKKGKVGGARVITYVKVLRNSVYLTSIFDKSEKSTITDKELKNIFTLIP